MSTFLGGNNPADRLVEVLAGSAAILSDPFAMTSGLPLSLTSLTGSGATDGTADQPSSGVLGALTPTPTGNPVTSLLTGTLGTGSSGLPVIGGSSGLPVIGELLNHGTQSDSSSGLPIIGDLLNLGGDGSSGLPVVGDLLDLGGHGAGSTLQLAGPDGALQPILNAANTLVLDFHSELETLSHDLGLAFVFHGVTDLGEAIGLGRIGTTTNPDGHTNLLTDVLNAPGSILDGGLTQTVAHLGADLSDIINSASELKDFVIFGSNPQDPTNPIPELITGLGNDLQHIPLLTINGGNNANDGGILGGILGNIAGSSTGHLLDLVVGPQQDNGLVLNLLSQPQAGPHHTAEVNAVDVGPTGPHLADLGVLTGLDSFHIPGLNGTGTDGLVGNLLGGILASGNTSNGPVTTPIDLGAIHDLLAVPLLTGHGILDTHGAHII